MCVGIEIKMMCLVKGRINVWEVILVLFKMFGYEVNSLGRSINNKFFIGRLN